MPVAAIPVDGVTSRIITSAVALREAYYPYEDRYPDDLNLRPGYELHDKLVAEVLRRAQTSHSLIARRYETWNNLEESLSSYMPIDDEEALIKGEDRRKPISIVIPMSSAILDTLITYFVAAFLDDPIFRYEGHGPEDNIGAILMEKIISLHTIKTKVALALCTMWRDSFVHGFGVVIPNWHVQRGLRVRRRPVNKFDFGSMSYKPSGFERFTEEGTIFEGNRLDNIDPYMFLPDPNLPIHRAAEGEFVGWMDRTNWFALYGEEQTDLDLFNVEYLKHFQATGTMYQISSSKRGAAELTGFLSGLPGRPVDRLTCYMDFIPSEIGMGPSHVPETWLFSIAGERVIIRAKQLRLNHGKKPVIISAPDFDGYGIAPISRIEQVQGIQGVVDWMINSHVANVRKAIHDMIVYDPSIINSADIEDPGPGKLVRLRLAAFGRVKASDAIHQLAVKDVTQPHVDFAQAMMQIGNVVSGAQDSLQGIRRTSGERVTATEYAGTQTSALSRLEKLAKLTSIQAHQDIAEMFAEHTQQFMSDDVYAKTIGEWPEIIAQEYGVQGGDPILVSPADISVGYDIVAKDGSVPASEQAGTWIQLFQILIAQPQIARKFDIVRIFMHIARLTGTKNFHEFMIKGGGIDQTIATREELEAMKTMGTMSKVEGGKGEE